MFDYLKNFFKSYFYEEEQFAALFLIVIVGLSLYFLGSAISPILIGILIAYLLNGLMNFFKNKGLKNNLCFYLTFSIFIFAYTLIFLTLPLISGQIGSLLNELPAIVAFIESLFNDLIATYPDYFTTEMDNSLGQKLENQNHTPQAYLSNKVFLL